MAENNDNQEVIPPNIVQPTINITIPSPDLRIEPFTTDDNPIITAEKWDNWVEDLTEAMEYYAITDEGKKLQALKQFGGKEVKHLIRHLPAPPDQNENQNESEFKKTMRKLRIHFIPMRNPDVHVFKFLKMKPEPDETSTRSAPDSEKRQNTATLVRIETKGSGNN